MNDAGNVHVRHGVAEFVSLRLLQFGGSFADDRLPDAGRVRDSCSCSKIRVSSFD